jgi:uncharacterized membrane protein YvbJ
MEESDSFCPFCGIEFDDNKELRNKGKKIQELEQKVKLLERQVNGGTSWEKNSFQNKFSFAWMIVPIVGFFVFMLLLVLILKMN